MFGNERYSDEGRFRKLFSEAAFRLSGRAEAETGTDEDPDLSREDFSVLDQESIQAAVDAFLRSEDRAGYVVRSIVGTGQSRCNGMDRVLSAAVEAGLCTEERITGKQSGSRATWREFADREPSLTRALHATAARTYGFDPVMICEVSTLVQADAIADRLGKQEWITCFEIGLVPVVEHGDVPSTRNGERVQFAGYDPSSRVCREFIASLTDLQAELRFAFPETIRSIQETMARAIPSVGKAVGMQFSALKKVETADIDTTPMRRAA